MALRQGTTSVGLHLSQKNTFSSSELKTCDNKHHPWLPAPVLLDLQTSWCRCAYRRYGRILRHYNGSQAGSPGPELHAMCQVSQKYLNLLAQAPNPPLAARSDGRTVRRNCAAALGHGVAARSFGAALWRH